MNYTYDQAYIVVEEATQSDSETINQELLNVVNHRTTCKLELREIKSIIAKILMSQHIVTDKRIWSAK